MAFSQPEFKIKLKFVKDSSTTQETQEVKQEIKETNKEIQADTVAKEKETNAEIERLLAERKAIYDKYAEKIRKGTNLSREEVDYGYKQKDENGQWARFYDMDSKQELEAPWEYEQILKKQLATKKEIADVDEIIEGSLEGQTEELSKGSKFLSAMKSGASSIIGVGQAIAGIIGAIVKTAVIVGVIASLIIALALVIKAFKMVRTESEEIQDKVATLKAMWDSIAYTLFPYIEKVVNKVLDMVIDTLRNVQWLVYKLTGVDILANASERFDKNLKSAKKTMDKILMGFDEVNKLTESNTSSSYTPQFLDGLTKMKTDEEVPSWLKWIYDNKDTLLLVFGAIGAAFAIKKVLDFGGAIMGLLGSSGAVSLLGTALGAISVIAAGIVITYICAKQVWDDIEQLKKDLKIIGDNAEKNKKTIEETRYSTEEGHKTFYRDAGIRQQSFNQLLKDCYSWYTQIGGLMDEELETLKKQLIAEDVFIDGEIKRYNQGKLTNDEQKDLNTYLDKQVDILDRAIWKLEYEGHDASQLKKILEKVKDEQWAVANGVEYSADSTHEQRLQAEQVNRELEEEKNKIKDIDNIDIEDKNFDVNANTSDAEWKLSNVLGKVWEIITAMTNGGLLDKGLNAIISGAKNSWNWVRNKIGFDGGGIVLPVPGKGVPIGPNAVMSERRAEGIIPLENPEAMEMLGQAIGRYVNIAIDNKLSVDGRTIARSVNNTNSINNFLTGR